MKKFGMQNFKKKGFLGWRVWQIFVRIALQYGKFQAGIKVYINFGIQWIFIRNFCWLSVWMGYLLKLRKFRVTLTCNRTESLKDQDRNRHRILIAMGERGRQTERKMREREGERKWGEGRLENIIIDFVFLHNASVCMWIKIGK